MLFLLKLWDSACFDKILYPFDGVGAFPNKLWCADLPKQSERLIEYIFQVPVHKPAATEDPLPPEAFSECQALPRR